MHIEKILKAASLARVLVLTACALYFPSAGAFAQQPNIILILADDIGVETVGAYGGPYSTPNIDALAASGVLFEQAHATPMCTPSRVRMLTGKYSFRNYEGFAHLSPKEPVISRMLKRAGYRTLVAGKWQLAGNGANAPDGVIPADAGFDESLVWYIERERKGRRYWRPTFVDDGVTTTFCDDDFGPDIVNRRVLDFIDRHQSAPFFVYYSMILAHDPWIKTPTSLQAQTVNEKFAGMMNYMDGLVGNLLRKLDELGLSENTLVLFIGDNGTHPDIHTVRNGREVQGGKWLTVNAGTHVPYVVSWEGTIAPNQRKMGLVDIMDTFSTIAAAAKLDDVEQLDSINLLPYIQGQVEHTRDHIFFHYNPNWTRGLDGAFIEPSRFVMDPPFKLYGDGRFYNTADDPREVSDIADQHGQKETDVFKYLEGVLNQIDDGPFTKPSPVPKVIPQKFLPPAHCPS